MNITWYDSAPAQALTECVLRALNTRCRPVTKGNDFSCPAWEAGKLSNGSTLYIVATDAFATYELWTIDAQGGQDAVASLSEVYTAADLLTFVGYLIATL